MSAVSFSGATCMEVGGNLWFPHDGEHPEAGAKRLCVGDSARDIKPCPVRATCLTYAIEHQIVEGVWGGLTYRERLKSVAA